MAEKPILFNGDMVRAILAGRKTQTRRIGKIQNPKYTELGVYHVGHATKGVEVLATYRAFPGRGTARWAICGCPFGKPGDVLWVRETFAPVHLWRHEPKFAATTVDYVYRADYARDPDRIARPHCWSPSIHMPREACRLFLRVKSVRVERLQDITDADALAEGVAPDIVGVMGLPRYPCYDGTGATLSPVKSFLQLWDSVYEKQGHRSEANPWVWRIEFERIENYKAETEAHRE